MQRYCQARADHDADLTHLLMRDVYPPDQVDAVVWLSVGRLWRVEIGIADQALPNSANSSPRSPTGPCESSNHSCIHPVSTCFQCTSTVETCRVDGSGVTLRLQRSPSTLLHDGHSRDPAQARRTQVVSRSPVDHNGPVRAVS
jgi:hypothetical protein